MIYHTRLWPGETVIDAIIRAGRFVDYNWHRGFRGYKVYLEGIDY